MARGCTDKRHHTTAYACFYVGVALLSCDVKKLLYDNASNSKFPKGDILNGVSDYCINLRWPTTVTTKPKTSRQKQNTSRQNQKPHGKSKYTRQNQSYFAFAVKYLVLPWGFWFCREVFCFCREVFGFAARYFVFAVRFLVLPWCFCFCREVFGFAVTVVAHHSIELHLNYSFRLRTGKYGFRVVFFG